jgi:hypothetical protein
MYVTRATTLAPNFFKSQRFDSTPLLSFVTQPTPWESHNILGVCGVGLPHPPRTLQTLPGEHKLQLVNVHLLQELTCYFVTVYIILQCHVSF